MFYQTMFIGLRERGCEGIACPKGVVSPLSGYPKSVIGLSVASSFRGKFADDCFLLMGFTIHPLLRHPTFACRVTLSKSQHVPRLRLLPAVESLSEAKAAFAY